MMHPTTAIVAFLLSALQPAVALPSALDARNPGPHWFVSPCLFSSQVHKGSYLTSSFRYFRRLDFYASGCPTVGQAGDRDYLTGTNETDTTCYYVSFNSVQNIRVTNLASQGLKAVLYHASPPFLTTNCAPQDKIAEITQDGCSIVPSGVSGPLCSDMIAC
jgi:hypothetical protein